MSLATNAGQLLATAAMRPAQFLLYLVSGLVPRRKNLWVFGSWGGWRYADNAAAFFRFCREHGDGELQLVWISRSRAIVLSIEQPSSDLRPGRDRRRAAVPGLRKPPRSSVGGGTWVAAYERR